MTSDVDRLRKEVRDLKARLTAIESSRWWRLNPRAALRRFRGGSHETVRDDAAPAHSFPLDFDESDVELCRRVGAYTMTAPPRIFALLRAVEYVAAREIPEPSSSAASGAAAA